MMKFLAVFGFLWAGLAHAADEYFDSNGVKIRYVVAGEGEPVVLIHGWMSDSSMWGQDGSGNTKLTPAPGFQVIALDCRGHGKSDKPHEADKYGVEMAADVVRLLDHLKIKKAHLIGYSMGSFIAGYIAATHPERVLSVIYGGQAPLLGPLKPSTGTGETEIFAKAVEEGKGLGPYIMAVMPPDRPKPTLEQANALAQLMFGKKDVKAFALAGVSLGALAVTPVELLRCKAPALFVYGGNESEAVRGSVAAAMKVLNWAQVKVIEGGDHVTTLGKPAFGAAIMEFLQAHKSVIKNLSEKRLLQGRG